MRMSINCSRMGGNWKEGNCLRATGNYFERIWMEIALKWEETGRKGTALRVFLITPRGGMKIALRRGELKGKELH